jgi:tripeptidyl-peptidase-1
MLFIGSFSFVAPERVVLEPSIKPYNSTLSTWAIHSKPASNSLISLTVGLKIDPDRRAALERTLYAVSDPKSAEYGKHRTQAQIKEILAVPDAQVKRVRNFFKEAGASAVEINPAADMMTVTIPVSGAESALQTELHTFTHKEKQQLRIVRASSAYSLPASVANDVLIVGELHQFPSVRTVLRGGVSEPAAETWPNACDAAGCAGKVTPAVLKEAYSISTGTPVNGNSMAVSEFQGQFFKPEDISKFSDSCKVSVTVDRQVGQEKDTAGVEAELDIEFIKGVAEEVPLTVVYNAQYSLLDWTNQITSLDDSPLIHSVSYGNDEAQQTSKEYMESCNTAFMKAGTSGLSILFASGDQGVCGREGCGFLKTKFHPDFPAGSPYITAVGGTDFAEKGVIGAEKAWNDGGGGFSDTFDIPEYQKDAVAAYLANPDADLPNKEWWTSTGRAYPDIAALAGQVNPYCVCSRGLFEGVAGTSAACPVAAGIFAKLNGLRLAKGNSPLGFLNPFIYQNGAKGFNDVKLGKVTGNTKGNGFTAVEGWDAATGFGTPNYAELAKLV